MWASEVRRQEVLKEITVAIEGELERELNKDRKNKVNPEVSSGNRCRKLMCSSLYSCVS